MSALLTCLFALMVLCYGAPAASAQDPVKNPSVATDGLLYAATEHADGYWEGLGQPARCPAEVYDYDEVGTLAGGVAARATVGGCDVLWERAWVRGIRKALRSRDWRFRRLVLEEVCEVAVHERGHNLGLNHDAGGIMEPVGGFRVGYCIAWSVQLVPAERLARPRIRAIMGSMKKIKSPQPKVRSFIGLAAHKATGAGKHGGSSRQQRRRDRQNTKRALRAGSED